jgi:two-component system, LytTR family, response regulator
MRMLKAIVVDDEPLGRAAVRAALRQEDGVDLVAEFGDGPAAVEGIRSIQPELVFLDVQMPGLDGFGVLSSLQPEQLPMVIFTTAFDQYAVRAFDVHAVDYVLKPYDDARLQRAVAEARARIEQGRWVETRQTLAGLLEELSPSVAAELPRRAGGGYARRVLVREGEEHFRYVRLDEVLSIGADGNHLVFHTVKGTRSVRMTMRALLPQLDPAVFRRIHRSSIVNLNAVKEIQPWFAGDCVVLLTDGRKLRMSRTFRDQLLQPLL